MKTYTEVPKFTPGPWIYYNANANQKGTPVYTLQSISNNTACVHDGIWIADIRKGRQGEEINPHEGAANARLIASAPDLFAACEAAIDALCVLGDEDLPALGQIVEALQKATGQRDMTIKNPSCTAASNGRSAE